MYLGTLACAVGVGVALDAALLRHPVDLFAGRESLSLLELDGGEWKGVGPVRR